METRDAKAEWGATEESDPSEDYSREDAAFERERDRLIREHLGKVALVRGDEVIGVFDDPGKAIVEGYRLFGGGRWLVCLIEERGETEDVPNVGANHPPPKPLD